VRRLVLAVLLFAAGSVRAQENPPPPTPAPPEVDPSGEVDKLKESCGAFKILPCAEELFTGKPVHIAVGSIAPQNGFGAGLAYLDHKTTDNWRITWNSDAVGSINGSWRAGFYLKFVDTHQKPITGGFGTKGKKKTRVLTELPEHPVFNLYVQAISLNKLTYFGLGPATLPAGRTFYGMTQTIVGGSAVKPFYERLHASLYGEINGRFVNIRPSAGQPSPSIGTVYTEATAPGLTSQPGTLQLGEGIRIRPVYFDDLLRLNYNLAYQQYFTPGNSTFSFQRLTADLYHEFVIRKKTRNLSKRDNNPNGPDECPPPSDPRSHPCEAITRDQEGAVGLSFFLATSMTPGGNTVPFYFQPTIGGVDINGNPSLSSYQDFRFRAPNVMFFRQNLEHSIWGPIGFSIMAEEGKVGFKRGDLGSNPWIHSFATGLTLRAGGFPQVFLLFAWGGKEGTHTIVNVNTSLLGGGGRPSLF
jgi:hypothetical protein